MKAKTRRRLRKSKVLKDLDKGSKRVSMVRLDHCTFSIYNHGIKIRDNSITTKTSCKCMILKTVFKEDFKRRMVFEGNVQDLKMFKYLKMLMG